MTAAAPYAPRLSSTTFYRSSLRDETIKRYSLGAVYQRSARWPRYMLRHIALILRMALGGFVGGLSSRRRLPIVMSRRSYARIPVLLRARGFGVEPNDSYTDVDDNKLLRCERDGVAVLLAITILPNSAAAGNPSDRTAAVDERTESVLVWVIGESLFRFWRFPRENRLRRLVVGNAKADFQKAHQLDPGIELPRLEPNASCSQFNMVVETPTGEQLTVDLMKAQQGPHQRADLTTDQIERVKRFRRVLAEADPMTFEEHVDNLRRDRDPNREILIWEKVAAGFDSYTCGSAPSQDEKRYAVHVLLLRSAQSDPEVIASLTDSGTLRPGVYAILKHYHWEPVRPKVLRL